MEDTPRRKLIKTNQEKENEMSSPILNKDIHEDDLAEKVEQCFRNKPYNDIYMMEIDEPNKKSSTRRRSRFRFSFSNNHHSSEEDQIKSRLNRTHSASIIIPDNQNEIHSLL